MEAATITAALAAVSSLMALTVLERLFGAPMRAGMQGARGILRGLSQPGGAPWRRAWLIFLLSFNSMASVECQLSPKNETGEGTTEGVAGSTGGGIVTVLLLCCLCASCHRRLNGNTGMQPYHGNTGIQMQQIQQQMAMQQQQQQWQQQQQQQWQQQQQLQQQMAMQQQMLMQQQQQLALSGTKLYHQTDFATANIIIQTQRMKPGSGGLAGGGIYFATTPELTAHKAHKKGVILEATVALGRIHTLEAAGDPTMTLQKLNSLGYNSVCIARAVSSGHEYVVYDPKQVSAIQYAPSHAPVQAVWSV
jgi:hypothetical protein